MKPLKTLLFVNALFAMALGARADVIALFSDWVGPSPGGPFEVTVTEPRVSVTDATKYTGGTATWPTFNRFGSASGYPTHPVLTLRAASTATTAAQALAGDHYFDFTLSTPVPGDLMTLTNLSFLGARGGTSTPRGTFVRSSVDGFATDLVYAEFPTVRPNWTAYSVALGPAFEDLTSVTFRFYMFGALTIELDEILLEGHVIPEPASVALVGLGLIALMWLRRRR